MDQPMITDMKDRSIDLLEKYHGTDTVRESRPFHTASYNHDRYNSCDSQLGKKDFQELIEDLSELSLEHGNNVPGYGGSSGEAWRFYSQ